jgi:hypothetical protein
MQHFRAPGMKGEIDVVIPRCRIYTVGVTSDEVKLKLEGGKYSRLQT